MELLAIPVAGRLAGPPVFLDELFVHFEGCQERGQRRTAETSQGPPLSELPTTRYLSTAI